MAIQPSYKPGWQDYKSRFDQLAQEEAVKMKNALSALATDTTRTEQYKRQTRQTAIAGYRDAVVATVKDFAKEAAAERGRLTTKLQKVYAEQDKAIRYSDIPGMTQILTIRVRNASQPIRTLTELYDTAKLSEDATRVLAVKAVSLDGFIEEGMRSGNMSEQTAAASLKAQFRADEQAEGEKIGGETLAKRKAIDDAEGQIRMKLLDLQSDFEGRNTMDLMNAPDTWINKAFGNRSVFATGQTDTPDGAVTQAINQTAGAAA